MHVVLQVEVGVFQAGVLVLEFLVSLFVVVLLVAEFLLVFLGISGLAFARFFVFELESVFQFSDLRSKLCFLSAPLVHIFLVIGIEYSLGLARRATFNKRRSVIV